MNASILPNGFSDLHIFIFGILMLNCYKTLIFVIHYFFSGRSGKRGKNHLRKSISDGMWVK